MLARAGGDDWAVGEPEHLMRAHVLAHDVDETGLGQKLIDFGTENGEKRALVV